MEIIPLGCGSAGSLIEPQSNYLVTNGNSNMLIDCGSCIRYPLKQIAGLTYNDIEAIYISHQHADHCGGVEDFAFTSYFTPGRRQGTRLYGNKRLLNDCWNQCWGGLRSIQGKCMTLDDYFYVKYIDENDDFVCNDIHFEIVQSIHVMNKYAMVPSYGLMIHVPESTKTVYLTTDQQFAPVQIMDFYKSADLIIQDCETGNYASGVHAHINELKALPEEVKAKMMLTHYGDNYAADIDAFDVAVKNVGFKGLCRKGVAIEW